ncbi:peptidase inhibitor family I36 protein [Rhizobacter sp. LjRoot28]|uniref:peptidase inhibitor family I36 protein n=1 Tax=Rhizobacter sp. LjRoot28 TaxID=3342309 RepID=UPI003ECD1030
MIRSRSTPAGRSSRPAGTARPAAWWWLSAALASSLALPAHAADYTDGVAVSGNTATLWFKSTVNTTWVDAHYTVNGGGQTNVRMAYSAANARHEQPVTVASGNVLSYSFTYNNGTPAYDTPPKSYTVGGPTDPAPTGIACFYEHANYVGASFCADGSSTYVGAAWNDRISSVKVRGGYQVQVFDNANHGGRAIVLTGDTASLATGNFNDITSSFKLAPTGDGLPTSDTPDFGPHVSIFDPTTPVTTIQAKLDAAFNAQLRSPTAQFGAQRDTFFFKPGRYNGVYANLGFYTAIVGLGQNPDDVTLQGAINVDSGWNYGDVSNATQNFWRSAENVALIPSGGTNRWAVSQAAPMRRIHIIGNLHLGPSNQDHGQGYASGGYIADSKVDGSISSGSQQQWYTRDSSIGVWYDGVWNMVFSGVTGAPANAFPTPPHTTLATTPVSREKPYLYIDSAGKYRVFVPALRTNAAGASWANGPTAGSSIPMSQFYVAKPGDSAARLNAALAQGLHLFFTPGTYHLEDTIRVTRANTVVLGIGFPTLVPDKGVNAMSVADVDGVKLAGLLFDAGTVNSQALLTVGPAGASARHAANPTTVQDVFFRIGGAVAGKATNSLIVNSHDTIIDHIWAWRADHGSFPTGWTVNPADTGVVVNGNHVLATGLFVEHYQKYQVIWNGQNGRTIFFQSEMPYDPPNQSTWRSDALGYAAYKVADSVTSHEAWGVGAYCFFNIDPTIHAGRGFEVPTVPGVRLHSAFTVSLGGVGVIDHVVNNTGGAAQGVSTVPVNIVHFP